jgi:hypothetical protein
MSSNTSNIRRDLISEDKRNTRRRKELETAKTPDHRRLNLRRSKGSIREALKSIIRTEENAVSCA